MPPRDCLSYITEPSHINPDCSPYRKLSGRKVFACLSLSLTGELIYVVAKFVYTSVAAATTILC